MKLFDHRLVYLTRQGPVVGRGWVRRCDCGDYASYKDRPLMVRFAMRGAKLVGAAELAFDSAERWSYTFISGSCA